MDFWRTGNRSAQTLDREYSSVAGTDVDGGRSVGEDGGVGECGDLAGRVAVDCESVSFDFVFVVGGESFAIAAGFVGVVCWNGHVGGRLVV